MGGRLFGFDGEQVAKTGRNGNFPAALDLQSGEQAARAPSKPSETGRASAPGLRRAMKFRRSRSYSASARTPPRAPSVGAAFPVRSTSSSSASKAALFFETAFADVGSAVIQGSVADLFADDAGRSGAESPERVGIRSVQFGIAQRAPEDVPVSHRDGDVGPPDTPKSRNALAASSLRRTLTPSCVSVEPERGGGIFFAQVPFVVQPQAGQRAAVSARVVVIASCVRFDQ